MRYTSFIAYSMTIISSLLSRGLISKVIFHSQIVLSMTTVVSIQSKSLHKALQIGLTGSIGTYIYHLLTILVCPTILYITARLENKKFIYVMLLFGFKFVVYTFYSFIDIWSQFILLIAILITIIIMISTDLITAIKNTVPMKINKHITTMQYILATSHNDSYS